MTNEYDPNAPLQQLFLQKGYQSFLKMLSVKQRQELIGKIADEHNRSMDDLLGD